MNKIFYTIAILLLLFPCLLKAQEKTLIKGKVTDEDGRPLASATVFISDSPYGTLSEDDGSFSFTTKIKDNVHLKAILMGFKTWEKEIDLKGLRELEVPVILKEKAVSLKEAVITASSYGSEKEKGLVLNRLDILTTPGGAADIYQSLKTMPGLTQVSESAELYVRGGDPLETTTIIDQAPLYHTFTFESGYGGLFSTINESIIKSLYFTSGGFSSRYGNSLSGILDLETANTPEVRNASLGLSMANASITAEIPFIANKLGARFNCQQSFTRPLFWLNGGLDRFTSAPSSKNATGSVIYSFSATDRIKLFGTYAADNEGVNVDQAEYNGEFHGDSKNLFLNLQNSTLLSENLLMKNSISYNRYLSLWKFGVLDLKRGDMVLGIRNDFEYVMNSNIKLLSGFELEERKVSYEGIIPYEKYNIRPDALSNTIDDALRTSRFGIYTEYQHLEPFHINNFTFSGGLRFDRFNQLKLAWTDPRLNAVYKISDRSGLRFSWGIFHQIPDPRLFAKSDGNPSLKAMRAVHYIASYDYELNDQNSFRVEVYHKAYKDLPRENSQTNYDNSGYGFANGVDVIFKGMLPFNVSGWISYGYISTKRLWMDFDEYTRSSFDITHNLAVVAKYNITPALQAGLSAKYATGKPFTDVISSNYQSQQKVFIPVHASTNSSRFPDYRRIDFRLNYFDQIFKSYPLVVYLEALNIFNFKNIFGYSYSDDYSEKRTIQSYFGQRMVVLGFTVNIQ